MKRLYYLDKLGWPVELYKGRWFLNFFRILIHTRKYTFKKPYCLMTPAEKEREGGSLDATLEVLQDLQSSVMATSHPCGGRIPNAVSLKDIAMVQPLDAPVKNGLFELAIPNALTRETLEKSERGEDVKSVDTVEELFEDLNSEDESPILIQPVIPVPKSLTYLGDIDA